MRPLSTHPLLSVYFFPAFTLALAATLKPLIKTCEAPAIIPSCHKTETVAELVSLMALGRRLYASLPLPLPYSSPFSLSIQ